MERVLLAPLFEGSRHTMARRFPTLASLWLALATCGAGCGHDYMIGDGDGGGGGPLRDGGTGPSDASEGPVDARATDALVLERTDAALPSDEPDVPVDARPSDDPAASAWGDPPVFGPGDACCTSATAVDLTTSDADLHDGGPVLSAFDGREWDVAWLVSAPSPTDWTARFRRLDQDAHPTIDTRVIPGMAFFAMAWGDHELAMAGALVTQPASASQIGAPIVAFADRDGAIHGVQQLRTGVVVDDLTRHPAIHGWAASAIDLSASPEHALLVTIADGAPVREIDLGRTDPWYGSTTIVSVGSRLVVAEIQRTTNTLETFANAGLARTTRRLDFGSDLAVARFRDTVVLFLLGGTFEGTLQTLVYDPFEDRIVTGPTPTFGIDPETTYRAAGDDLGGTIGLCYAEGGTIRFALFGHDGVPLGTSLELGHGYDASSAAPLPSCTIASAARDEYVVAWYGGSFTYGPIHATTVRVRR